MDRQAAFRSEDSRRRFRWLHWLAGALIVLFFLTPIGLYAWRYVVNPCEVQAVQEASTFLKTQLNFYDRVYQVAVTASPTSLDYPVITMQQILMDTQEVSVPACMQTAKNALISYMEAVIRAFRAWGAGETDATIRDLLQQSDVQYASFRAELRKLNKCAPFCMP
jgi:hypothetical protein